MRYSGKITQSVSGVSIPVPGAKVYVYDSSAPNAALTSLTDDEGDALANPVITDAYGDFFFNSSQGSKGLDVWFGGERKWREDIFVGLQSVPPIFASAGSIPSPLTDGSVVSITAEDTIAVWNGTQLQRHFTRNWLENQPGFDITNPVAVTTCLQTALTQGKPVELRSGVEYPVKGRCDIYNGSGVVCDGPVPATFLLKTGAGQFDANTIGTPGSSNRSFLVAEGRSNVRIEGVDFRLEANAAIRTAIIAVLTGCTDPNVEAIRFYNFKEQDGGYIRSGTNQYPKFRNILGYDCTPASTTLGSMQLTVVEDSGSYGGRFIDITGRNIGIASANRTLYGGSQSDVLNVQGNGNGGAFISDIFGDNVGEVVDFWASNSRLENIRGNNVHNHLLKIIYGASFNSVNGVTGNGTGLSAVFMGAAPPASLRPEPIKDNDVRGINVTGVGSLWATEHQPRGQSMHAGIQVEGDQQPTVALRPSGNRFEGRINGHSPNVMPYAFFSQSAGVGAGDTNTFRGGGRNFVTSFSAYTGPTAPAVTQE